AADDAEVDVVGKSPAEPRKQVAAIDMVLDLCNRCVEAVVDEVVQAGDQVNQFRCRHYRSMKFTNALRDACAGSAIARTSAPAAAFATSSLPPGPWSTLSFPIDDVRLSKPANCEVRRLLSKSRTRPLVNSGMASR